MGWLGFKAAISSTDGKWRTQTICFSVVDQSTGQMPQSQTLALKSDWNGMEYTRKHVKRGGSRAGGVVHPIDVICSDYYTP